MELFKIDGITVEPPSAIRVEIFPCDSEESGRDAEATMHRDVIATKRKLICEWNALNSQKISQLFKAVKPAFIKVSYHDPEDGIFETRTFYVSERTAPMYSARNNEIIWTMAAMNFIER